MTDQQADDVLAKWRQRSIALLTEAKHLPWWRPLRYWRLVDAADATDRCANELEDACRRTT